MASGSTGSGKQARLAAYGKSQAAKRAGTQRRST